MNKKLMKERCQKYFRDIKSGKLSKKQLVAQRNNVIEKQGLPEQWRNKLIDSIDYQLDTRFSATRRTKSETEVDEIIAPLWKKIESNYDLSGNTLVNRIKTGSWKTSIQCKYISYRKSGLGVVISAVQKINSSKVKLVVRNYSVIKGNKYNKMYVFELTNIELAMTLFENRLCRLVAS